MTNRIAHYLCLQEVAKKIVHETRGNPLALASVATAIVDRPDDLEEWDYVYHNFSSMLRSMKGAASVLGERHSSGFWITMGVSLLRLEIDALKLLVLVCMCTAPSVPEEVFQVLYIATQFQDGFEKFKRARKGLESRELIKITSLDDGRSWSVHSLLKPFIQVEQSEWQEITFNELVAVPTSTESRVRPKESREFLGDEDGMIQTAICGLYFDGHFSERAASSIAVPLDRFDNLRRNAIEPITRLLGRPVSERWRTASQKSAKQVSSAQQNLNSISNRICLSREEFHAHVMSIGSFEISNYGNAFSLFFFTKNIQPGQADVMIFARLSSPHVQLHRV